MPVTSRGLFGTVQNIQNGTSALDWTDINNMLVDGGDSNYASILFTNSLPTDLARLTSPSSGPSVDPGVEITNIEIRLRCQKSNSSSLYQCAAVQCVIQGGTSKQTAEFSSAAGFVTLSGDLAYWGITQQEAHEFAAGTRYFQFAMDVTGGSISFSGRVMYVDAQFTYFGNKVGMPCIF